METDALIAAFGRLRTNDLRREALEALVQELTPYEWRALQKTTAARSFQYDIIGQLPVELVAQVFAYLDISTPYCLQRVSRQWRHILQSPDVLKNSLCSWSISAADLRDADYSLYELKTKQIQAFRVGEPKRYFRIETHNPHGHVILVEDTLIWSCASASNGRARSIYVFNIKTWCLQTFNGDARETVHRLFASDQLVGFATGSNLCYAWALDGREKRTFRVPNPALFQSVTCRANTVACVGYLGHRALVYIWNYDTQRGSSFGIGFDTPLFANLTPGSEHLHGLALLLQPKDEHIVVVTNECGSVHNGHQGGYLANNRSAKIRYSRYTFAGQCMSVSEITLRDLPRNQAYNLRYQFTPINRHGLFRFSNSIVWLQFDERLNKFTKPKPDIRDNGTWVDASLFCWNGVSFHTIRSRMYRSSEEPYHVLMQLGTSEKPTIKALVCRATNTDDKEFIHLNDKYVIRALSNTFEILCFGDSREHTYTDESFFNIGSSRESDIAEHWRPQGQDFYPIW